MPDITKRRTSAEILSETHVVGHLVRTLRKQLKLTQIELSERTGLGVRFIKEIESGKETARMDKVNELLGYFGYELQPVKKDGTSS